ncbi:hypothetical protein BDM02DRAFT_3124610 [Thelephora ganbajun]|uniref:Uncharacterized protein n=1 Tax=Thelephora ganbajun TaxID=370292 RepID=A0ACB6YYL4_THEGA|nr:hypothetical protein BDM02DRAFT_3124610 [Thelephora ganbajun]
MTQHAGDESCWTNGHDGKVVGRNYGDLEDEVNSRPSQRQRSGGLSVETFRRTDRHGTQELDSIPRALSNRELNSKGVTKDCLFSPLEAPAPKTEEGANYRKGCGSRLGRGVGPCKRLGLRGRAGQRGADLEGRSWS